jgi:signal transduction histidine kinase
LSAAAPSIATRLARALLSWSLAWGVAVGAAVWLAAAHEVDELLDDALESSALLLAELVGSREANGAAPVPVPVQANERFAWQVVAPDGVVLMRSSRAPVQAWFATASAGFASRPQWRVFGHALGSEGRMLYAAQTRSERDEARAEVAFGAVLAALAVGLLGHVWLRARVRRELEPLQGLSQRLAAWDPEAAAPGLGAAERRELQPVHRAIEALTARLAARVANEQAFSAHAAHALRTPLAGIDAQLAVAQRECPPEAPELRQRLARVRGAATRLQAVVAALLGLFRSGGGAVAQRRAVDVPALVARLPAPALQVHVQAAATLQADPDLLAAALMNLLDNAERHGASEVHIEAVGAATLRITDNGPGASPERLAQLGSAISAERYGGNTGLGLMLADRVARAHGGCLTLPQGAPDAPGKRGFTVELHLQPGAAR